MRYLILIPALLAAPAQAHEFQQSVADCACDAACYTEEVAALSCSGDRVRFRAGGLPSAAEPVMTGITASNQQFPRPHDYRFELRRAPRLAAQPTPTEPGAIGVAVNGIPIFDPSTRGPVQAATGKPISAAEAGELDSCGGHAGRGDDYHYHRAPNCLIEALGAEAIETQRRPIGFAADGFPIHALGWFDAGNDIEHHLDACRGTTDAAGRYFYNVETGGEFAVLDCYSGTPRGFARDDWDQRRDASGAEIEGVPFKFTITRSESVAHGGGTCSALYGTSPELEVVQNGRAERLRGVEGALFYCDQSCYGHFEEADWSGRGRPLSFASVTTGCPAGFKALAGNGFLSLTP